MQTFLAAFPGPALMLPATILTAFFASVVTDALGFDGDAGASSDTLLASSVVPLGLASVVVVEVSTGLVISLFSDTWTLLAVLDS